MTASKKGGLISVPAASLCIAPSYVSSFVCPEAACPLVPATSGGARPPRCPALRDLHIGGIYERSLRLACPAACAHVLFQTGAFHFQTATLPASRLLAANAEIPMLSEPLPEISYLLDLQRTCMKLLTTSRYPLDVRLILLGIYLEDAVDFIEQGQGYELGKIIKSYDSPMFEARFHEALRNISFEPLQHLNFLWGIIKNIAADPHSPLAREDVSRAARAFHLGSTPDLQHIARAFPVCRRSLESYVTIPFPQLLEHFLLHQWFTELYPCAVRGGLIHNYWCFVIAAKVYELLLTGLAAIERQILTSHQIAELTSRAARLPQSPACLAAIEKALAPHEEDSLWMFNTLFHVQEHASGTSA